MESPPVAVECYAGHRGEDTPRSIVLGGRRVGVREVLDRWLSPNHRYFKLRGDDGATYIVRHDVAGDRWDLTLFESGSADLHVRGVAPLASRSGPA